MSGKSIQLSERRDFGGLGEKGEGIKQQQKNLIDTDNSAVITRGKSGYWEVEEDKGGINGHGGKLVSGW